MLLNDALLSQNESPTRIQISKMASLSPSGRYISQGQALEHMSEHAYAFEYASECRLLDLEGKICEVQCYGPRNTISNVKDSFLFDGKDYASF